MSRSSELITALVAVPFLLIASNPLYASSDTQADSDASKLHDYLSSLQVGMTPKDAERALENGDWISIFSLHSALRHLHRYQSLSDGTTVILQYDDHQKLVSWKGTKGQP